jgi:hypothetical protein
MPDGKKSGSLRRAMCPSGRLPRSKKIVEPALHSNRPEARAFLFAPATRVL